MKAKQIEKLLIGVMNNFLESITDEEVKKIIKENSFITGGCIPSMLMDEWVNDYDIYFYQDEDAHIVRSYFKRQESKPKTDTKGKFHVKLITENSINLSDKIQLVTKFTGMPCQVTENFDWQHIKSYFYYNTHEERYNLVLTNDVYKLIVEKELVYTGSAYPLSSFLRLKKYLKKGWNVSTATMVHIALDIAKSLREMEAERIEDNKVKELEELSLKLRKDRLREKDTFEDHDDMDDKELEIDDEELEIWEDDLNSCSSGNKGQCIDKFNVDDIIYHLNGVDPLTIQKELQEKSGQYLTIEQIVELLER